MSLRSVVLPARPRPFLLAAWAFLAFLNVSAGFFIASWPERQSDLESIHQWSHEWLVDGTNVYAVHESSDYPPHALLLLSPLGVLPLAPTVWIWALFNLVLAIAAAALSIRAVRPDARWAEMALPMLMFLCWGGFRTLLQFTLVALVFGLLAMRLADRKPVSSGICLGVSLMKPQIAIPFLLWAILTRRWRQVAIALSVPIAGFAIYCLRAGTSPILVVREYLGILGRFYVFDEELMMVGLSQLRPIISAAISSPATASILAIAVSLVLFGLIVWLGLGETGRRDPLMISAPPLAAVWSLLTFYHPTYGFVILLPVATLLIFMNDSRTLVHRRRLFWALQLLLMIDIPGVWGRLEPFAGNELSRWVTPLAAHADRMWMIALFVALAKLAIVQGSASFKRLPLAGVPGARAGA